MENKLYTCCTVSLAVFKWGTFQALLNKHHFWNCIGLLLFCIHHHVLQPHTYYCIQSVIIVVFMSPVEHILYGTNGPLQNATYHCERVQAVKIQHIKKSTNWTVQVLFGKEEEKKTKKTPKVDQPSTYLLFPLILCGVAGSWRWSQPTLGETRSPPWPGKHKYMLCWWAMMYRCTHKFIQLWEGCTAFCTITTGCAPMATFFLISSFSGLAALPAVTGGTGYTILLAIELAGLEFVYCLAFSLTKDIQPLAALSRKSNLGEVQGFISDIAVYTNRAKSTWSLHATKM